LLLAASLAASAQSSKTVVDNDQVKVLSVTVEPHKKTRLHDHKINRVMIYLNPGTQDINYQDGKKQKLTWTAGEPKWSPASGMHIAEITSEKPVTIVEVELKKPGSKSAKPTGAMDPVKLDPKHYKIEFENDQVRVLSVNIGPKESVPMHEHTRDRVVTYLTDMDFRITSGEGKADHAVHKAGDVAFSSYAKHKEENLAAAPLKLVVVELKN
jgi:uncharacterized RmlC-like cupin family protein